MKYKYLSQQFLGLIMLILPISSIAQSLLERCELLREYYYSSYNDPDSLRFKDLFFEEFPNSFQDYEIIYGLNAPLNSESFNHVVIRFASLRSDIDSLDYYRKIISIAIGGNYNESIAPFHFGVLRKATLENPKLTFYLLSELDNDQIISFFSFYFDGVHPSFQIPEEFLHMEREYPDIFLLMKEGMMKTKMNHPFDN